MHKFQTAGAVRRYRPVLAGTYWVSVQRSIRKLRKCSMKASLYSVPPLPDQPELEEVNTMLRRIRPANLGAHIA